MFVSKSKNNICSNIQNINRQMNILYQHFVEQIKAEEIEKYNRKHHNYLVRSGKIKGIQPVHANRIIIKNNQNKGQNVPPASKQVQPKTRRKREFDAPRRNKAAKETDTIKTENHPISYNEKTKREFPMKEQVPQKQRQIRPLRTNFEEEALKYQEKQIQSRTSFNPQPKLQQSPPRVTPNPFINKNQNQEQYNQQYQQLSRKNQPAEMTQEYGEVQLVECPEGCGRKFAPATLQKHMKICQKVFQQKRKPFQVKKTDKQAQMLKKKSSHKEKDQKKSNIPKWKIESEKLRIQMKQAKGQQVEQTIPITDDRIECPGCGRKFNETAATRHIQFCKKKNKIK